MWRHSMLIQTSCLSRGRGSINYPGEAVKCLWLSRGSPPPHPDFLQLSLRDSFRVTSAHTHNADRGLRTGQGVAAAVATPSARDGEAATGRSSDVAAAEGVPN
ncbi:hypothetical protein MTO96_052309 [Rhipicephalus appendiculatus]